MPTPQRVCGFVKQIIDHGLHVYTVEIQAEKRFPRFRPGQFMHLAIDEYDPSGFWPESRVFSIASSPDHLDTITMTYSVKGLFTSRMEKELHLGKRVWSKLPYGDFIISKDQENITLFAGGTGVTAFTAFIESLDKNSIQRVSIFYGAKTPDLLIYAPMLMKKLKEIPYFNVFFYAQNNYQDKNISIPTQKGVLSLQKALPYMGSPDTTIFYLSGPPEMIKALSNDLKNAGFASDRIKIDAWD